MLRDIIALFASLFVFGIVYAVMAIIVNMLKAVFVVNDAIVVGIFFIFSIVPLIYYIALAKRFIESRKITRVN